ncbi:MAG: C1 family peptidase [Chloroflexota bacterium]
MKKVIKLSIGFILTAAVFTALFLSSNTSVQAQGVPAQWEAFIELSPDQLKNAQASSEALSAAMQVVGVTRSLQNKSLVLSGSQGMEQLRSALFDQAAPYADFLGGPAELNLTIPAGTTPVLLRLEARITAGYLWKVASTAPVSITQVGESTFEPRYRGYGAPSIQSIQIQSSATESQVIRLVYRRSFEPNAPIHARLSLNATEMGGVIEISDPTPKAPVAEALTTQADPGVDPFAELTPQALPASFDWRTQGIVPAVRDQGYCGGCWAFGTVAVMESAVKKGGGPLTDLSEQFLISCNSDGWDCGGGLTASMYHTTTLGNNQIVAGAVLESLKPYTATNGTCSVAYPHAYKASSWQFIVADEITMPSVTQIKTAIYTYGPVTAGVCVGSAWDNYTGGVFMTDETASDCTDSYGPYTNHQIVLVGWNDATQSWILRNSWGSSWGINGYMNIKWGTSRVGEGTSWIKYVGVPSTLRPDGDTYTLRPTYSWARVSTASSYKLKVKDVATGLFPINGITVSNSYCNATTNRCWYTPTTSLAANKSYQWQVASVGGNGVYSALRSFKVVNGFSSSFTNSSTGWVKGSGGSWVQTASSIYTTGAASKYSSLRYNQSFSNFTYQARMMRVSSGTSASGMVVRGTPTFGADYNWASGYQFMYNQQGNFAVYRRVSGVTTVLKTWTPSSAILKNGWNTLKVVADGNYLRYYINNVLVWSGTDTVLKTGQVGLWMVRGTTAEKFDVDWATLGMSELYKAAAK